MNESFSYKCGWLRGVSGGKVLCEEGSGVNGKLPEDS